jgi:hypothetical protein
MRRIALVGVLGSLLLPVSADAATLEPVGDFVNPTFLTSYPDDPDKLLVVERAGRVELVDHGAVSTFLDATSLVGIIEGERGMWSIALAPDFASTRRLYAIYAGSVTGGDIQLDEFRAQGDAVDLSSRRPVLTIEHSERANHNGGQLQFGPDGYLYISTGDGDRRSLNGQDLTTLLGKLLRIDPRESGGAPYSIPADNPFVGIVGQDEIWSYGLRNPYRFSFDRVTGALAIGDVGRQRLEEVDYDPGTSPGRGDNYGWPCFEGSEIRNTDPTFCTSPQDLVFPIQEYDHNDGYCSVIGGYVVRDRSLGALYGRYLDADLCAGVVRSLIPAVPQAVDERSEGITVARPVSFGEDSCGRLYVLSLNGPVSRLVGNTPADCQAGYARVTGDVLVVNTGVGVANRLAVFSSSSGAEWVVQDGAAPLDAGPSCVQARVNRVRCPKATVRSLRVDLSAGSDRIRTPAGLHATIEAGAGDDRATTADEADALRGGPGNDQLDGGTGPDELDGGAERDTVLYGARAAGEPVEVSLDGVANDGGAVDGGARDNVRSNVENVVGGAGADTLTGSAVRNALTGGRGADGLNGLGGDDTIRANGDGSTDTISCGTGRDQAFADPADLFIDRGACERVN